MRKCLAYLHLVLALPAGIVIMIMCLTGALMSFDELLRPIWPVWEGLYSFLMGTHRWLLADDRTVGRLITGVSTLFFVILLISGSCLWWPRRKAQWKNSLRIKCGTGIQRKLLDSHRIIGIYAVGMLLLLSLTGLMWSFPVYRNAVASVVTVGRVPDRVAVTYKTDRQTGERKRIDFNEQPPERKLMRWVYLLHTGRWGGWLGTALTCLAALAGVSLPITGYWLYIRRLRCRS